MEQMKFKPEHYEQVCFLQNINISRYFSCKYFKNVYRPEAVNIY